MFPHKIQVLVCPGFTLKNDAINLVLETVIDKFKLVLYSHVSMVMTLPDIITHLIYNYSSDNVNNIAA